MSQTSVGMNGIAEGVRQVRGSAVNQVDDVAHVVVTAGTGVPTSGLVLASAGSTVPWIMIAPRPTDPCVPGVGLCPSPPLP